MGFTDVTLELIAALEEKRYQASARGGRNLLASKRWSPERVAAILRACNPGDYECSPLDDDPTVDAHIYTPRIGRVNYYIKAYFNEDEEQVAVFISAKLSDYQ